MKNLIKKKWFAIVMLVLFFPVGLFLVWRNTGFKKKTKAIITGVFAVFLIFAGACDSTPVDDDYGTMQTEDIEDTEDTEVEEVEEVEETAPAVSEEESEAIRFKADLRSLDNPRFELYDGGELNINFDLSDNLTNNMIIKGYYLDVKNACKELKDNPTIDKYTGICFVAETDFVNSYGETSRQNAIMATISVEDIKRIQYDKITTDQFQNIINTGFIHPALRK